MIVEALAPLAIKRNGQILTLRPGERVQLSEEQGHRLLHNAAGKVRVIPERLLVETRAASVGESALWPAVVAGEPLEGAGHRPATGGAPVLVEPAVTGRRTLSLAVHGDPQPAEVFLRVTGSEVTADTVALLDVLARMMTVALQPGAPLATVADPLRGVTVEPGGSVTGPARIRCSTGLPDLIGRHLLGDCCGRTDLTHRQAATARQLPGEEGAVGHKP